MASYVRVYYHQSTDEIALFAVICWCAFLGSYIELLTEQIFELEGA